MSRPSASMRCKNACRWRMMRSAQSAICSLNIVASFRTWCSAMRDFSSAFFCAIAFWYSCKSKKYVGFSLDISKSMKWRRSEGDSLSVFISSGENTTAMKLPNRSPMRLTGWLPTLRLFLLREESSTSTSIFPCARATAPRDVGAVAALADAFRVPRRAERFAEAQKPDRFQQVGLARGVFALQHVDAVRKDDLQRGVAPVVFQRQGGQPHARLLTAYRTISNPRG